MRFKNIEEEIIFNKLMNGSSKVKIDTKSDEGTSREILIDNNALANNETINEFFTEISHRIATMEATRINHPDYIMPKQPFYRPVKKIRYFAKRVIRKSTNWALGSSFDRQSEFNNSVVPAIGRLTELQTMTLNNLNLDKTQIAQSAERITALEEKAEEAGQTAEQSTERIATLEEKTEKTGQTAAQNAERIMTLERKAEEAGQTAAQSAERIAALEEKIQVLEQWFIQSAKAMETVNDSVRIMEAQGILQQTQSINDADVKENLVKHSLSQSGEDTILAYILNTLGIPEKDCTYLDLGANHAKKYSNTYYFYKKGARGVLVEANPALIPELKLYRNEDVILNCCIGAIESEPINFYVLNGDGLSTPEKKRVDEVIAMNPSLKIDRVVSINNMTVNQILDTYFDKAPVFLNIDLEGDDIAILSSIDWEKYRPLMISIEMIPYRPRLVVGEKDDDIMRFMEEHEYVEYAFTGINSIFLDKRQIKDVLS